MYSTCRIGGLLYCAVKQLLTIYAFCQLVMIIFDLPLPVSLQRTLKQKLNYVHVMCANQDESCTQILINTDIQYIVTSMAPEKCLPI